MTSEIHRLSLVCPSVEGWLMVYFKPRYHLFITLYGPWRFVSSLTHHSVVSPVWLPILSGPRRFSHWLATAWHTAVCNTINAIHPAQLTWITAGDVEVYHDIHRHRVSTQSQEYSFDSQGGFAAERVGVWPTSGVSFWLERCVLLVARWAPMEAATDTPPEVLNQLGGQSKNSVGPLEWSSRYHLLGTSPMTRR